MTPVHTRFLATISTHPMPPEKRVEGGMIPYARPCEAAGKGVHRHGGRDRKEVFEVCNQQFDLAQFGVGLRPPAPNEHRLESIQIDLHCVLKLFTGLIDAAGASVVSRSLRQPVRFIERRGEVRNALPRNDERIPIGAERCHPTRRHDQVAHFHQ